MTDKTLIERLTDPAMVGAYDGSDWEQAAREAADTLSRQAARIADLEAGVSKIARGDVPPQKEGHYLAHREAVRIARALLSPAVEGGGGERNMASREPSTDTCAAPLASEQAGQEWLPIANAPRGGVILLWFPDLPGQEVQFGYWHTYEDAPWCPGEWRDRDNSEEFIRGDDARVHPSHWMPSIEGPAS